MFIRINQGNAELVDADNFTAFHVEAGGLNPSALAMQLGDLALPAASTDDHLWIYKVELMVLAGDDRVPGDWLLEFEVMCGNAERKGWINEEGTHIRAHIE